MKFEVGKTYKTKSGQSVRIICVDRKNTTRPLLGLIDQGNSERFFAWAADGTFYGPLAPVHPMNLVHPPREFWVNLYSSGTSKPHLDKKSADNYAGSTRIECIKVREVRED